MKSRLAHTLISVLAALILADASVAAMRWALERPLERDLAPYVEAHRGLGGQRL